jgi:hypothetical protein
MVWYYCEGSSNYVLIYRKREKTGGTTLFQPTLTYPIVMESPRRLENSWTYWGWKLIGNVRVGKGAISMCLSMTSKKKDSKNNKQTNYGIVGI